MAAPASNALTLEVLNLQREEQKEVLKNVTAELDAIQTQILNHPDLPDLPSKGTTTIGDFKITTGFNRRWNQPALSSLKTTLEAEHGMVPALWPFKLEWKEDIKRMDVLREGWPDIAKKIEEDGLSTQPKKPYFTSTDKKD